jgi:hypothetical protein
LNIRLLGSHVCGVEGFEDGFCLFEKMEDRGCQRGKKKNQTWTFWH